MEDWAVIMELNGSYFSYSTPHWSERFQTALSLRWCAAEGKELTVKYFIFFSMSLIYCVSSQQNPVEGLLQRLFA